MTSAYQARYGHKAQPYLTRGLAEGATYRQVARALGITVTRVAQLESTGLARLRRCLEMIETGVRVDDAIEACRGRNGRPRKRGGK